MCNVKVCEWRSGSFPRGHRLRPGEGGEGYTAKIVTLNTAIRKAIYGASPRGAQALGETPFNDSASPIAGWICRDHETTDNTIWKVAIKIVADTWRRTAGSAL